MKAREFDKRFDSGQDISKYLDMTKARRPEQEHKTVNVDFPLWMIHLLDKEARKLRVPRQLDWCDSSHPTGCVNPV